MTLEHLIEFKNKTNDFLELHRILGEFYLAYNKILDTHISDDEVNSNQDLEICISDIFKRIDDIKVDIDIITRFIVR